MLFQLSQLLLGMIRDLLFLLVSRLVVVIHNHRPPATQWSNHNICIYQLCGSSATSSDSRHLWADRDPPRLLVGWTIQQWLNLLGWYKFFESTNKEWITWKQETIYGIEPLVIWILLKALIIHTIRISLKWVAEKSSRQNLKAIAGWQFCTSQDPGVLVKFAGDCRPNWDEQKAKNLEARPVLWG